MYGIAREIKSQVIVEVPLSTTRGDYLAIWDTGATNSVISSKVAKQLSLVPTGMAQTHGVHGAENVKTYVVNIGLVNPTGNGDAEVLSMPGIQVTEAEGLMGCDVLIGMDIITEGDFSVTHYAGTTMFSFRVPSQHHVDYGGIHRDLRLITTNPLQSHEVIRPYDASNKSKPFSGTSRNELCPCGSGKKYKKCHGR